MIKLKRLPFFIIICALLMPKTALANYTQAQSLLLQTQSLPLQTQSLPQIQSELALVVCAQTGHIIYSHGDPHARAMPASMTKVMTALLLLESGAAWDDIIMHTSEAVFGIPRNSSHIYMSPGEVLTVSQALYAIMLPSANDVSNAIAEFISGDLESFNQLMNNRARELGAYNTNFTNAHGLPHADHFTTPYDMHLIMREALTHEKFVEVINTARFIIPPTAHQPQPRIIDNTNLMVRPTSPQFTLSIVGGKTGWTTPSGHTLVSYARQSETSVITVVMLAQRREDIFNDTRELINYAFDQFVPHTFFNASEFEQTIKTAQRSNHGVIVTGYADVFAQDNITLYIPKTLNPQNIQLTTILPERVLSPTPENFVVGSVSATLNGQVLAYAPLALTYATTPLDLNSLTGNAPRPFPAMIYDMSDYFILPGWLSNPTPATYAVLAAISITLIALIIKLFSLIGNKKRRRIYKSKKPQISKSYRYR